MSDITNNLTSLALAVRTRRKALGLTQADLAELCDIQRQTVGRLENADPGVALGAAMSVADALGLDAQFAPAVSG